MAVILVKLVKSTNKNEDLMIKGYYCIYFRLKSVRKKRIKCAFGRKSGVQTVKEKWCMISVFGRGFMRKTEHINKTVRIPKNLNDLVGELSSNHSISINRFIICACALAAKLIMSGMLNIDFFVRQGANYDIDDLFFDIRRIK